MEYSIEFTHQYLKDLKLARKRGLNEDRLNEVIRCLASGKSLLPKHKDHLLVGVIFNRIGCLFMSGKRV